MRGAAGQQETVTAIAQGDRNEARIAPGLVLVFGRGSRPDREAVTAALAHHPRAAISHDPATAAHPPHTVARQNPHTEDDDWLELILDGLTFDLLGLRPGPAIATPEIEYLFNCDVDDRSSGEAIGLYPGPHIAAGAHSLPVVRTLLGLGATLTQALGGIGAVCWPPARSSIAPKFFAKTVEAWLAGGPFPALGMLGMRFDEQVGLLSEGLEFFIGAELSIGPDLCADRTKATRLAVRIVQQLVGSEDLTEGRELMTEAGDALRLEPDPVNGLVRVACA
ncbi:MAG: hypothetical protein AB3N06_01340 [Erythrobacter sp.]